MVFSRGNAIARFVFFLLVFAAIFFFAGCSNKKPLSKSEIRSVTAEIVAAAQKANGRKSEITIRPETSQSFTGDMGQLAADHIYVSLADPAQATSLKSALATIAHRHHLAISVATSSGAQLLQ